MKKLLVVSYDFPPSSIGIWRTLKFCRYMPEFGWKASILTVKEVRGSRYDLGPLKEIPDDTEIRRTESLDHNRVVYRLKGPPKSLIQKGHSEQKSTNSVGRWVMDIARRWVLIPDDRALWYPFAVREGLRWLKQEKFDAIYTTSYPNTAHLVGLKLAQVSGLPLVADFRDSWTGNYTYFRPATKLHAAIQLGLEAAVVREAAQVVTATEPITEDFRTRFPKEDPNKFSTITNGFDPTDYDFASAKPDRSVYTITFAGTMYGAQSPENFFRAVRAVLTAHPEWRRVLRLRFVGGMIEEYQAMIGKFGLSDITRVDAYLPHGEALTVMAEADALLLMVAPVKGAEIMMTQKVFEYAASRRPIIGLVPKGAARGFLKELGEGPILHPKNVGGIERSLTHMISHWQKHGRITLGDNSVLKRYERLELTKVLCSRLDAALSS